MLLTGDKKCLFLLMTLMFSTKASNGGKSLSRGTEKRMAYAIFDAHKLAFLNVTFTGLNYVVKESECGLYCVKTPSGFSFNLAAFHDISGNLPCKLLPTDIYNNSDKFVTSEQFHHYRILSPCISWPCQNNWTCAAQYEEDSYVCICIKGYTGKHCEIGPLSVTLCEGNTQSLSCASGATVEVLEAMFGRQNSHSCPGDIRTTDCIAVNSLSVVYNKCHAKESCLLKAHTSWFSDPCQWTFKYLFVKYQCI